jgi:hypothetical protein
VGIDLLCQHLRALAVQSRRQRFTRNLTPHPCIVAHGCAARKDRELNGAAPKSGVAWTSGLITLGSDDLNNGPILPMVPSSWGHDCPNVDF